MVTPAAQPYTDSMPVRVLITLITAAALSAGVALAGEKMVDPKTVKPEFRQAAEKRAAEQRKLAACQKQADTQKLRPRYRVKFLTDCIDK